MGQGRKRVLNVEDWAEIRRLRRAEKLPIAEIARVLRISRNTVKSALASKGPPKYQRAPAGSVVDEVEPRIRELLAVYPRMPATVIAERIEWGYSIRTLSERVRELRPVYLPAGSGVAHELCGRGDRPVRFLVPRRAGAGRLRSGPHRDSVAGVDDGVRLFAVGLGIVDSDSGRRRPVCRLVAAYFGAGCYSAGVRLGWRRRGGAVAGTP